MKLILASASPRRATVLRQAGLSFTVLSSAVDETPIPGESPQALVQRLAGNHGALKSWPISTTFSLRAASLQEDSAPEVYCYAHPTCLP